MERRGIHIVCLAALLCLAGCRTQSGTAPTVEPPASAANPQVVPAADPNVVRAAATVPAPSVTLAPVARDQVPRLPGPRSANQPWNLSLDDAISTMLKNSPVVRTLDGGAVSISDVTGYDVATAQEHALAACAAFDPYVTAGVTSYWFNQPPGTFFGPGIPITDRSEQWTFSAALAQPLITGGEARIAYNPPTGFYYVPGGNPGTFNPAVEADLEMSWRQSLLRGAGIAVNKAPMRIAQVRYEQSTWDLKQAMLSAVRSVQEAYWNLQAAQAALAAVEQVLPPAEEIVRVQRDHLQAQRVTRADVAKADAQLHLYLQRRLNAESAVADAEARLRYLMGVEQFDGRNIIATTPPAAALVRRDPESVMQTALENRPDIIRQRLNLKIREYEMLIAKNGTLPQLDLVGLYRLNGLGQDINFAWDQMWTAHYSDWQAGGQFSMPLGNRAATANARAVGDQLQKDRALLDQSVLGAAYQLSDILRQLNYTYGEYREAIERSGDVDAWIDTARLRYQNPPAAGGGQDWLIVALNDYYLALQTKLDAAADASALLAQYNTLLAKLDEATGTLLATCNIEMLNDPCGQAGVRKLPRSEPAAMTAVTQLTDLQRVYGPPSQRPVGQSPAFGATPTALPATALSPTVSTPVTIGPMSAVPPPAYEAMRPRAPAPVPQQPAFGANPTALSPTALSPAVPTPLAIGPMSVVPPTVYQAMRPPSPALAPPANDSPPMSRQPADTDSPWIHLYGPIAGRGDDPSAPPATNDPWVHLYP